MRPLADADTAVATLPKSCCAAAAAAIHCASLPSSPTPTKRTKPHPRPRQRTAPLTRLDVSVHDAHRVQPLEPQQHLLQDGLDHLRLPLLLVALIVHAPQHQSLQGLREPAQAAVQAVCALGVRLGGEGCIGGALYGGKKPGVGLATSTLQPRSARHALHDARYKAHPMQPQCVRSEPHLPASSRSQTATPATAFPWACCPRCRPQQSSPCTRRSATPPGGCA